jgi:hypothetical protein
VNRRAHELAEEAYASLRDALLADLAEDFPAEAIESWRPGVRELGEQ